MAQPLQFQQTFIPTDFGSMGQLTGLYSRDLAIRDQKYDQAVAMENEFISRLYDQETYNPEALNSEVGKFISKIDEAVQKRGGDYGAAAKDIARIGARELSNPFYKLNQKQVEQGKMLEKLLATRPDLKVLRDPRTTPLTPNTSIEDLNLEVADPANIQNSIKDIFGSLASRVRQSPLRRTPNTPAGFLETSVTRGLTSEEIDSMLSDPTTMEAIIARNPQVAKYMEDPSVQSWFVNQVKQGFKGFEGGTTIDYQRDPTFSMEGSTRRSGASDFVVLRDIINRDIQSGELPFTTTKDLFRPISNTFDKIKAEYLKSEIKNRLVDPNINSSADKDSKLIVELETSTGKDGLEVVNEIANYSGSLPSAGEIFSTFITDSKKVGAFLGALLKLQPAAQQSVLSLSTDPIKRAFKNTKENLETLKTVHHSPFTKYIDEKKRTYSKYGIDKLESNVRDEFLADVNRVNKKASVLGDDVISENYGKYPIQFKDFNSTTGYKSIDEDMIENRKDLETSVRSQIPFDEFTILQSSADDIVKDLEKFKKKKSDLYNKYQTTYRIAGSYVDKNYGPIYSIETENEDGGLDYHIATAYSPEVNRTILTKYGSDNVPVIENGSFVRDEATQGPLMSSLRDMYELYIGVERLKAKYNNDINNVPGYKSFPGGTVTDFINHITNLNIPEQDKQDAVLTLREVLRVPENIKIK